MRVSPRTLLRRPQYDFRALASNAPAFDRSIVLREWPKHMVVNVEHTMQDYKRLNALKAKRDALVHERNLVQAKVVSAPVQEKKALVQQLSSLKTQISDENATIASLEPMVFDSIDRIPNLISPDVEALKENQVIDTINEHLKIPRCDSRDHLAIASALELVDFTSGSKVTGSAWYYLTNHGALLESALVQYALARSIRHKYKPVIPPAVVRKEYAEACGFKPRDLNNEQQSYMVGDDLCLAGTAEIPLAAWASDLTFASLAEPVKLVGVSRSYRAEAGSRGRESRGLYRVHEFTKVELFWWTRNHIDCSSQGLEEILSLQKNIIQELGLSARVLNMAPNDLGAPAYKKYDIETWMPGKGIWGELTSASNCLDYQSRRLHTKYRDEDGNLQFPHTLNGTAMAVPRVIMALLESHYDPDKQRVKVPEALRPFLGLDYVEKM